MNPSTFDPQTILKDFEKLRADYKRQSAQVATKEDLATQQRDKELVEQASNYTADSIFKSLAKLQTAFGESTSKLAKDMSAEVEKLAQIQRAIQVESSRLDSLRNVQIAAEALNILQQEHQKTLQNLEETFQKKDEILETEIAKRREFWQKMRQDYETQQAKQKASQEKDRRLEVEDHQYALQRKHTLDADTYEKQQRDLERQLAEEQQRKEKDWAEREQFLTAHQAEFEKNKTRVEKAPKELEEAIKKAREEAIKDTHKDEENKAKLLEKEVESRRKAYELKVESLKQIISEQKTQITELSQQLQTASSQAQKLAMQAVTSTGSTKSTERATK
jgi:hypothetical protein